MQPTSPAGRTSGRSRRCPAAGSNTRTDWDGGLRIPYRIRRAGACPLDGRRRSGRSRRGWGSFRGRSGPTRWSWSGSSDSQWSPPPSLGPAHRRRRPAPRSLLWVDRRHHGACQQAEPTPGADRGTPFRPQPRPARRRSTTAPRRPLRRRHRPEQLAHGRRRRPLSRLAHRRGRCGGRTAGMKRGQLIARPRRCPARSRPTPPAFAAPSGHWMRRSRESPRRRPPVQAPPVA